MKTERLNLDNVYAKLLALSIIYEKEENCRQIFLEKISYTHREIKAMMKVVSDTEFRNWIVSAISVMQCRE
jgi:hypothetical protein